MVATESDSSGICKQRDEKLMKKKHFIEECDETLLPDKSFISPRFRELLEGLNVPGDCGNSLYPPAWLDKDLFERGKCVYEEFLFCTFFAEILGLLMTFSLSRIAKPLIFTHMSDTPRKALKRYLYTTAHIMTWFENDVWNAGDTGHKDILRIRKKHNEIASKMNCRQSLLIEDLKLSNDFTPSCGLSTQIQRDLKNINCPFLRGSSSKDNVVFLSQFDMVITQYAFVGLMVTHPRRMGAKWISKKELEGFIHYWRGIGWLLGIDDEYNLCKGSLEEVRSLCFEIERMYIIPNLAKANYTYDHMSESLMRGTNFFIPCLDLPAMFSYLMITFDVETPSIRISMSWRSYFYLLLIRFVFSFLLIFPFILLGFNGLLRLALRVAKGEVPVRFPFNVFSRFLKRKVYK